MKWKRILIAIAIALLAVVGLQCFWLFRQYSTQHARLRQQLDDAIAECDYGELLVRGRRFYHKQMTVEYAINRNSCGSRYTSSGKAILSRRLPLRNIR